MARKKKVSTFEKIKDQIRSGVFISLVSLGVIIFLFLVISIVSQNQSDEDQRNQQRQEEKQPETKLEAANTPKTHTVVAGDNLSKISEKYYGDKNDWNIIAAENQIANPSLLHVGIVLKIPNLDRQTSSITTNTQSNTEKTNTTVNEPKTYTVVAGDTLWEISQQFYAGDGYQWFRIRDVNPDKVGLLSNGRPLIEPGTVLKIPNLN